MSCKRKQQIESLGVIDSGHISQQKMKMMMRKRWRRSMERVGEEEEESLF